MSVQDYGQRTYVDGEVIFKEGDRAAETYLIKSGNVRLSRLDDGETLEIDVVGTGHIFGEMAVISDMNRMASATAVGETVCTWMHRREIHQRIDKLNPDQQSALGFLITYCQDFLPFELEKNRPQDEDTAKRDLTARKMVNSGTRSATFSGLDAFLGGIFRCLLNYAKRRLPPSRR